jgi:hypothetical protein
MVWFGAILFVCGLFQLPMAVFFDSASYDIDNPNDRTWRAGGSASCLNQQRVCLNQDCTLYAGRCSTLRSPDVFEISCAFVGEFHHPSSSRPRFDPNYSTKDLPFTDDLFPYNDDNKVASPKSELGANIGKSDSQIILTEDKLTVGKRSCELRSWFGIMDFSMMLFILFALLALGRWQDWENEEIDISEQTAQDYAVRIFSPHSSNTDKGSLSHVDGPNLLDPDVWKVRMQI